MWATDSPTGFGDMGAVVGFEIPKADAEMSEHWMMVGRDIKPSEIVFVDRHTNLDVPGRQGEARHFLGAQRIGHQRTSDYAADYHKLYVEAALAAGKKVPDEVLAEYPDLKKHSFPEHKGRPGQRGGSLPRGESAEEVGQLEETATKKGGFTYNPVRYKDRTPPKRGFALSIKKNTEKVIKLDQTHEKIRAQLKDYIRAHRADIKKEGNFLGGWIDKGKLYVDISKVVKDKDDAINLAREAKQLAVFDLGKGQTIEVPKAA